MLILFLKDQGGLGKPQKKIILLAGPLRGGGVVKGRPLRKKELFSELFLKFCCHLKINFFFTLDDLSEYGHHFKVT